MTLYHLIFIVKIKINMRVCIIGSGLSALTLAKALVNEKVYVDVASLDKNHKINKSRTIGISKSNFEYFNENLINIENIVWKLKKIEIFTDNLKNKKILNFDSNNDQLFSIVKNFQLYDLLNKNLSNNKYCKKIKFTKKYLKLDQYNLIINTDYSSFLTKKFFNKNIIKKYNSSAHTTIIKHDKISNNVATQIFTKNGPLAFLPISEEETSIVYSMHNSKNIHMENMNDIINQYNFHYKIKTISKIETVELKSFNLRSYFHDNILAFGDLLHRLHPLAGQGFNMTIRDVKTFIQIIKNRIALGLPLDQSVNFEFEKKMRHKNLIFSTGVDMVHEIFNFERKLNSSVLSKSIQMICNNSSLNKIFIKIADKGIAI